MKKLSLIPLLLLFIILPASAAYYWTVPKTNQCDVTLKTATTKPKNVTFDTNITNFLNRVNTLFTDKCILSEKPPVVVPPTCVAPQELNPITNTCETPVVVPSEDSIIEPPPHATWCEGSCTLPAGVTAKVWYGVAQTKWVTKDSLTGTFGCNDSTFGSNAGTTEYKRCAWVNVATLNALNPNGANLMPYVDMTSLPTPKTGASTLKLYSIPVIAGRDKTQEGGEFRITCEISHLAKDDPIVYPNIPGAAHLHAFFGNVGINAYSTNESLRTTGNSTCSGGIANRSGYWVPALIDTTTGKPANPYGVITYYKSEAPEFADYTTAPPKGLRMIAGNQKPLSMADSSAFYLCMDSQQAMNPANWGILWESDHIQACGDGTSRYTLRFKVEFPQCWDGKNLDSPDHQSHMAYACKYGQCELANGTLGKTINGCPVSHPVLIPQVTINANYSNLIGSHEYRLSSDNYSTKYPGGYSLHADWMNGWDETILKRVIDSCMLKHANCDTDKLGDGQGLVPFDQ